ncbi:MAG: hypothetical protein WBD22_15420 [Pyrinomonadaceae bacterium]
MRKDLTRSFIFFIIIASAAGIASAQVDRQFAAIRAQVDAINGQIATYNKTTKKVDGISLEGTEADYFVSDDRRLRKINARISGETYRAVTELYYSGDHLIFAFQRLDRLDGRMTSKIKPKVAGTEESRTYFSNGSLIRYQTSRTSVRSLGMRFDEKVNEIADLSGRLRAAFVQ